MTQHDTAFQFAASNLRFGTGITREVGHDLVDLGVQRTLLLIDAALCDTPTAQTVIASLKAARVDYEVYDRIVVEPTDASFREASAFARRGRFDSFLAVGGGSTIDTAKAANLYSTHDADFFDFVNAPIGKGLPVPGPLKPLIAIPTTAGTGSETTGVAIFDYVEKRAKTGIAHRYLKPTLGIVDADNTRTLPPAVAASSGLDVLSHALESYTAIPYTSRPRPARPLERPAYQGCNPVSDVWALRALELVAEFLLRAVADPKDDEARANMLLASAVAGMGFGNAGVHLPHGMSYPGRGNGEGLPAARLSRRPSARATRHVGHPAHAGRRSLHGVCLSRAAICEPPGRWGPRSRGVAPESAGDVLAARIIHFMRCVDMPNGLKAVGYAEADIPALVEGTLPQHRVTKLSPRPAGPEELAELFRASMCVW